MAKWIGIGIVVVALCVGVAWETAAQTTDWRHRWDEPSSQPTFNPESLSPQSLSRKWKWNLRITKMRCAHDPGSIIAEWTIDVTNVSKTTDFKDLHFTTTHFGASGTKIDESFFGHTEYRIVPHGKSIVIKFTEVTNPQSHSSLAVLDGATIAN